MIKVFIILFFLLGLYSCNTVEKKIWDFSFLGEIPNVDYIEHLASVGSDYLATDEIKEIKLNTDSISFLSQVYERIVANNEALLVNPSKPSFHVIKSKTPFLFSLPHSQFFFSSGLFEKYFKSEEIFVAAFAAEVLKSDRNIYEKRVFTPLGYFSTEKVISLVRVRSETKFLLNEWTYFILKRSGYDASAYLNWIQVQNRNTLDFSLYLGDMIEISKEEHSFKNFMSKQGIAGVEKKYNEANSSKAYYKLLNNIVSSK